MTVRRHSLRVSFYWVECMWKGRKLTEAECEVLRKNPAVKEARPNRFTLHFEFRKALYEYWNTHGKSPQAIREFMAANEFDVSIFSCLLNEMNSNHATAITTHYKSSNPVLVSSKSRGHYCLCLDKQDLGGQFNMENGTRKKETVLT